MDNAAEYISNLTLYDIKSAVRKVQNEMEALVREATNNEPWGASSTQLSEIAEGTTNYTHFNEIMAMIYRRFTEKSAEEWRQIYKALQLLEYLIKNGSERVIDDARAHLSTIKMLRNFHYIDEKMKDQGINVRNRAKELTELLQDSEAIRNERRKAKSNTKKFGAVSSDSAFSSGGSSAGFGNSGKKYGGFSSEDYGSGSAGAVYGDGGGYTNSSSTSRVYGDGGGTSGTASPAYGESTNTPSSARREREKSKRPRPVAGFAESALGSVAAPAERFDDFDEYEVGSSSGSRSASAAKTTVPKPIPKKDAPKPKEVDLFSFDDEPTPAAAPASRTVPKIITQADDDDEFDDFQSASTAVTATQPAKVASLMNVMGPPSPQKSMGSVPTFPQPPQAASNITSSQFSGLSGMSAIPSKPAMTTAPTGPNYYASGLFQTQTQGNTIQAIAPPITQTTSKPAGGDAFGDLLAGFKMPSNSTSKSESLSEMNKKSASAGIWAAPAKSASIKSTPVIDNDDDDFGDFSGSSSKAASSSMKPSNGNTTTSNVDLLF